MMEVTDANVAGNVHGGVVMRLVDTAAALAAIRHAGGLAVTVSLDEMTFLEPVHIGDVLTLHAAVNDVGTTSHGVRRPRRGREPDHRVRRVHAASAYLVFVAIDEEGHPCPVPPLLAESDDRATTPTRGQAPSQDPHGAQGSRQGRPQRPSPLRLKLGGGSPAWEDGRTTSSRQEGSDVTMTTDLTGARRRMETADGAVDIYRLDTADTATSTRLPKTVKILLENLLRRAGTRDVSDEDVARAGRVARTREGHRVHARPAS